MTHVYIIFYLLHMEFINRSTTVLKLEVFFLISLSGQIFLQGFLKGRSLDHFLGPRLIQPLSSNTKLFADDTSLFSVMHYITQSGINLNDDLEKINNSAFQWKMSFNPDINKQAQEVSFFAKFTSQIILL